MIRLITVLILQLFFRRVDSSIHDTQKLQYAALGLTGFPQGLCAIYNTSIPSAPLQVHNGSGRPILSSEDMSFLPVASSDWKTKAGIKTSPVVYILPALHYGLNPGFHMAHSYESLLASLEVISHPSSPLLGHRIVLVLPQEYMQLPFAEHLVGHFSKNHSVEVAHVGSNLQLCYEGAGFVVGGAGFTYFAHTRFQGEQARSLLLSSCGLDEASLPTTTEVLFYERHPHHGTQRMIMNADSLCDWFNQQGHTCERVYVPTRFCDQILLLHRNYSLIISTHGNHLTNMLVGDRNVVLLEIAPRQYYNTMMCQPSRAVGFNHFIFASSTTEPTLTLRDWCMSTNKVIWETCPTCPLRPGQESIGANVVLSPQEMSTIHKLHYGVHALRSGMIVNGSILLGALIDRTKNITIYIKNP